MPVAYIGLGSNLGDRRQQLEAALAAMQAAGLAVETVSAFIETEPYGVTDQPPFLNGVCSIRTALAPLALLQLLLSIEKQLGRVRTLHWGPRVIDLDLLLYDDVVMNEPDLTLPHPDMQNRLFVLQPLAEIAPAVVHPRLRKTISELLDALQNRSQ